MFVRILTIAICPSFRIRQQRSKGYSHGWQSNTTDKDSDSGTTRPVAVSVVLRCHPWGLFVFASRRHLSVLLFFCLPFFRFVAARIRGLRTRSVIRVLKIQHSLICNQRHFNLDGLLQRQTSCDHLATQIVAYYGDAVRSCHQFLEPIAVFALPALRTGPSVP